MGLPLCSSVIRKIYYLPGMKKSDIIVRVLTRVNPAKTEEQLRKEVEPILIKLNLEDWNTPVAASVKDAIIQNIRSQSGNRSFEYLIRDLDLILRSH